jgi:hypothetical protein
MEYHFLLTLTFSGTKLGRKIGAWLSSRTVVRKFSAWDVVILFSSAFAIICDPPRQKRFSSNEFTI